MSLLQIALVLLFCGCWAAAQNPIVDVPGLGKLKGNTAKSTILKREFYQFRGIPFGQPPSGPLRFKPPVPVEPWDDVKNALIWGRKCPQTGIFKGGFDMWAFHDIETEEKRPMDTDATDMEDCLYIQVYSPNLTVEAKLPVMVFFHGGAFSGGSSNIYNAHHFMDHDVIIVVPHYRLGPIGFLSMQNEEIPGNAAMLDQVLALEWVQKHISAFGGDPDQVTAFGESAGAASVSLHAVSPLSKGLFKRIIAQSGSALAEWALDREPVENAIGIAKAAGCDISLTEEEIVNCLMTVDAMVLTRAYKNDYSIEQKKLGKTGFGGCSPVIQTTGTKIFLDKDPAEYVFDPEWEPVPAMYGANKHEGTYVMAIVYEGYLEANDLLEDKDFLKYRTVKVFLDLFGLKDPAGLINDALEYKYIGVDRMGNLTQMIPGFIDFSGATFLKGPSLENLKVHARKAPSYWYGFNYGPGKNSLWSQVGSLDVPFPGGVCHANELLMLFNIPTYLLDEEEAALCAKVVKLWSNFAIYGEPNPKENRVDGVPDWPEYDEEKENYMRIDTEFLLLSDFTKEYTIAVDENFALG